MIRAMLAALVLTASAPVPGHATQREGAPSSVRCGAVERPGVATLGADGNWSGPAVEMCRAAARAAYGPDMPVDFHGYNGLDGLAAAADDHIAFLSGPELAVLRGRVRPGPIAAVEEQVLLVPAGSGSATLNGRMVCFINGSAAEDALDAWAQAHGVTIEHLGFQEPDEMADAYAVGKCTALAADAQEMRNYAAQSRPSEVLAEPLATLPIIAATPTGADARWTAIVRSVASTAR